MTTAPAATPGSAGIARGVPVDDFRTGHTACGAAVRPLQWGPARMQGMQGMQGEHDKEQGHQRPVGTG